LKERASRATGWTESEGGGSDDEIKRLHNTIILSSSQRLLETVLQQAIFVLAVASLTIDLCGAASREEWTKLGSSAEKTQ